MSTNVDIKRPIGIVVIATISAIYAIILSGLYGIVLIDLAASGGKGTHTFGLVAIVFGLITTVFVIAVTVGLWKMKIWGYYLALLGNGATILYTLYSGATSEFNTSHLSSVVNILVIAYLVNLKSKSQFH